METIDLVNLLLFSGAALVLAGILSSLMARRFGTPLLLIFLLLGMVAGEDGPGGIRFEDYRLAYLVGSLALSIILFDGGLRTRLASLSGVLAPAVLLATVGVVVTAGLTGLFAALVLGVGPLQGLLVGATIASTDAAAVFFLLRSGGLQLRGRVNALLEIESSTNDPVSVILTLLLVGLVTAQGEVGGGAVALFVVRQAAIGAALGGLGGLFLSFVLNRVELPAGLHPLFAVAGAVALFGLTARLDGSGFLAVYLAGLVVGNRPVRALPSITAFHDTATWLAQIIMFIMLGLLVTPSRLLGTLGPALAIAVFLMVVGRPAAVVLCLKPFGFDWRETGFVSWVGLRGAVSIFLAAIPTLAGTAGHELYFHVAFVVVLVSLLVQGWSLRPLAKRMGLALPRARPAVHRVDIDLPGQAEHEMVGYLIEEGSAILARGAAPGWVKPVFVVRRDAILQPDSAGELQPGDYGYFLVEPERVRELDRIFARSSGAKPAPPLSGFPLRADATLGLVDTFYGLGIPANLHGRTIAEHFAVEFEGEPEPGDRVPLGPAALIARAVEDGRVTESTLEVEEEDEGAGSVPPAEAWFRRVASTLAGRRA
ncbi:MAG TPA: potassium/proton antiporter [Hyphomicrobiales bacterium]|nr:potassium/proton antiporter [Hyphomicrobiales bacterium]